MPVVDRICMFEKYTDNSIHTTEQQNNQMLKHTIKFNSKFNGGVGGYLNNI